MDTRKRHWVSKDFDYNVPSKPPLPYPRLEVLGQVLFEIRDLLIEVVDRTPPVKRNAKTNKKFKEARIKKREKDASDRQERDGKVSQPDNGHGTKQWFKR